MKGFLTFISIVSIIAGIFFLYRGYDVKNNYYSSEYYSSLNTNAYVGGDAYNYIINGNYFTGYMVIGGICILIGFISMAAASVIDRLEKIALKVKDTKTIEDSLDNLIGVVKNQNPESIKRDIEDNLPEL